MKTTLFLLTFLFAFGNASAQTGNGPDKTEKTFNGKRKYQIVVSSLPEDSITKTNAFFDKNNNRNNNGATNRGWSDLGKCIEDSYKSVLTQKTVTATSGLIDLGISTISGILLKNSKDFNDWINIKQSQCNYNHLISSSQSIGDFYYMHSAEGTFDPHHLKFNGISCRNFIEVEELAKSDGNEKTRIGHDAYYVSCKLRIDSLGKAHMANHSKFYMDIDTLVFYPEFCNIPRSERYDTTKYTNLQLNIKMEIYSSWTNEAAMLFSDQKIGTFNITAKIESSAIKDIDGERVFFYHKGDTVNKKLVSITGDSFIVPRSFVGTSVNPLWGTGEYRIELEVSENCQLNPKHYIKVEELGNAEAVNFANLPGYKKWEKQVWKTEYKKMKKRAKDDSFFKNALTVMKSAYLGHNWVKELVEPAVNPIYEHETKALKDLFDLDDEKQKF